jgi:hypothetical protein
MHEHGSQNRDPAMPGNDLRRDGRPLRDKRIPARKFEQKNNDIYDDNGAGNDWHP